MVLEKTLESAGVRRGSAGGERPAAPASLPGNPGTELGTRVAPQIPGAQPGSRQGGDYSWDSGVAPRIGPLGVLVPQVPSGFGGRWVGRHC